jgi:hypothetical protein
MPDISKCANENCPMKHSCYRYTAQPSEYWQSYGSFEYSFVTDSCKYYWYNNKFNKKG